jgi:hypothetical protein
MTEPRMTVVIPTRERCDVLDKALRTVTVQDYENLEILVSDNYSRDRTEDVVRAANDKRIRYVNTGKRLSMSHNWEFALSHVSEGWVTIIGDDDGLLPGSLNKVAAIIRSTGVQAVRSSVCQYQWPSMTGTDFGRLSIPLGIGYQVRGSEAWLARVMNGQAGYSELPMLYNGGFVSVPVLQEIARKSGTVYRSCSPDIYSAIAVASAIGTYAYSREPLAVNGASSHSTGTASFSPPPQPNGSPVDKFRSEPNIPFHECIPLQHDGNYPLSIQVSVYESYLQSVCLRDAVAEDMHAQQLELILATPGAHRRSVEEWGRIFAQKHGLKYEPIWRRARLRGAALSLISLSGLKERVLNSCSVGSRELPIRDVYEASACVAAIREAPPPRLEELRRKAARAMKRLLGG